MILKKTNKKPALIKQLYNEITHSFKKNEKTNKNGHASKDSNKRVCRVYHSLWENKGN